jgi:hypothetical protein
LCLVLYVVLQYSIDSMRFFFGGMQGAIFYSASRS